MRVLVDVPGGVKSKPVKRKAAVISIASHLPLPSRSALSPKGLPLTTSSHSRVLVDVPGGVNSKATVNCNAFHLPHRSLPECPSPPL
jgi:hypothetical protein